jgi:integrase
MRLFKKAPKEQWGSLPILPWYIEFKDHMDIIRRMALFTDRRASEEIGRKIDQMVAYKVSGQPPDITLSRWLDAAPLSIKKPLAKIGLLDPSRVALARPLMEHLDEYIAELLANGVTVKHATLKRARTTKLLKACGFQFWSDISGSKVQRYLTDLHNQGKGRSAKTTNFYAHGIGALVRWMVKTGRAKDNPLGEITLLNEHLDRRHDRRALTIDELKRLLQAARTGPVRGGMIGEERAFLYMLAVETGLRANELRTLTKGNLDLDASPPTITVAASFSKHRRQDTLALRPATAAVLRERLKLALPNALVISVPKAPSELIKADLETAGIAYRDAMGKFRDFHALRHTAITLLVQNGVHPRTVQAFARHSSIELTMQVYTHPALLDQASALTKLPDLRAPEPGKEQKSGMTG